jgi:HEAT repeat protein
VLLRLPGRQLGGSGEVTLSIPISFYKKVENPPPAPPVNHPPAHWVAVLRKGDDPGARERLVQFGPAAVPDLAKALRDSDPRMRLISAQILEQIGAASAVALDELTTAVGDSDDRVRIAAMRAIGQTGANGRRAFSKILLASGDTNTEVMAAARTVLQKLGPPTKADAPAIELLMRGASDQARQNMASTIRQLNPSAEAVEAIFGPLAKDSNPAVRREAALAATALDPASRGIAAPILLLLALDTNQDVSSTSRAGLKRLAPFKRDDIPVLRLGLKHSQGQVRAFAAWAVATLGSDAEQFVPVLGTMLRDNDRDARSAAAKTLAEIGPMSAAAIDGLLLARQDADAEIRQHSITALGKIGRRDSVIPALLAALEDESTPVRDAAIQALNSLQPPLNKDDLPQLESAIKSRSPVARKFAADSLGKLGPSNDAVGPILMKAIKDPDWKVRLSVWTALGAMGPKAKEAAPEILQSVRDVVEKNPRPNGTAGVITQAAKTLNQFQASNTMIPIIGSALKSRDVSIQLEAIEAVGELGVAGVPLARDLIALFPGEAVREPAKKSLSKLGKPVVPSLVDALDSNNRATQLAAIQTLGMIGSPDARSALVALHQLAKLRKFPEVSDAAKEAIEKIGR